MASSLGSLVVSLGLDAAQFTDGLTKSEYQARQFARNVGATVTRIAGTFTLLAGAAAAPVAALRALTGEMDDLSKAAQRAAMPTEEFTALAYAGGLADVAVERLQASMGRLAKAQDDAVRTGTSPQAEAFRKLGIAIQDSDGRLRSSSEVFKDFADRFQRFGPTTEVVAAGMQIFGRSFQELIPLIKDGREGLESAADEARAFGLVLSTEAGRQAEEFNDNLSRLGLAITGIKRTIVAEALPAFVDLTAELVKTAKGVTDVDGAIRQMANDGTFKEWARNTAIAVGTVTESLTFVVKAARAVAGSFETVWADAMFSIDVARLGPGAILFESNRRQLAESLDKRNRTVEEANKRYRDLWEYNATWITDSLRQRFSAEDAAHLDPWAMMGEGPPRPLLGGGGDSGSGTPGRRVIDQAALTDEQRALIAATRLYQDVEKRAQDYAATMEWLDRLFFDGAITVQQYDLAMAQLVRTTESVGEDGTRALRQFAESWLDTIDPMRDFIRNLERVDQAVAAGFLSPEEGAKVKQALGGLTEELDRSQTFMEQFYENAQRNLGDGLYDMMQGNFDNIGKSFAQMIQRMVADAAAADIMKWLFGGKDAGLSGGVIGGFFSGLFGGARAGGGPVVPGRAYLVGEKGPELLVPGAAGNVVPNHRLGGGPSVTVNQSITIDSRSDQATILAAMNQAKEMAKAEIHQAIRSGSPAY